MAVHRSVTPLVVNGGATSRGSAGSASVGRVVGVDALGVGDPAEGGEADGVTAPPGVDVGSAGVLVGVGLEMLSCNTANTSATETMPSPLVSFVSHC